MKRRGTRGVPVGALGVRQEDMATRTQPALTRGQEGRLEPVLGGRPAVAEARRVLLGSLAEAERLARMEQEQERRVEFFARFEADADAKLLAAISLSVPPREGEDDAAYSARLAEVAAALRVRVDPATVVSSAPARYARPTNVRQPLASDLIGIVPTRKERKRVNPDLYRRLRRPPTDEETLVAVWRLRQGEAP